MRKLKINKLVALMLSMVILFTVINPVTAHAQIDGVETYLSYDGRTSVASFIMDGITFKIRTVELHGGDFIFYEYHDEQLISKGRIYANKMDRMYITTFIPEYEFSRSRSSEAIEEVFFFDTVIEPIYHTEMYETISPHNQPGVLLGRFLGTINYLSLFNNSHMLRADVSYLEGTRTHQRLHIRNQTLTLLQLTGLVVAALSMPVAAAGSVASWILFGLGIVSAVGPFFIQEVNALSIRTHVTISSRNADNWSQTSRFTTARYEVVEENNRFFGQTFYPDFSSNNLWSVWGNDRFADTVRERLFGIAAGWRVLAWT
ncbi:MAG: hypothetical protein FWF81_02935 [Defluviitaleaceae bacterium]|nr:hypothetical protein [Defluviitaleaceae bacterium]